jgi:uncharacterized protein (DUF433 family)
MEAARTYKNLLWQDPDRMSGALCFYGTRIPVSFLFDYLENGSSLESFCLDYRINQEVALQVVQLANEGLTSFLQEAA